MCLTGGAISGPWRTIQRNNDASHRAICLQIRNITSYNHQQTTVVAGGRCCEVGGLLVSNAWWEEDNDGNDLITSWVVLDHDGDHGPVLSEWRLHPSSEHVNTVSWWHLNMSTLSADDIWHSSWETLPTNQSMFSHSQDYKELVIPRRQKYVLLIYFDYYWFVIQLRAWFYEQELKPSKMMPAPRVLYYAEYI